MEFIKKLFKQTNDPKCLTHKELVQKVNKSENKISDIERRLSKNRKSIDALLSGKLYVVYKINNLDNSYLSGFDNNGEPLWSFEYLVRGNYKVYVDGNISTATPALYTLETAKKFAKKYDAFIENNFTHERVNIDDVFVKEEN